MSALQAAWETLVHAVRADGPSPAHVDHATLALLQLAPYSSADEVAALMTEAAAEVRTSRLSAVAPIAMSCGALIEQGAPAGELADALADRLPAILASAMAYAEAVDALESGPTAEDAPGDWVGDRFAPDDWVRARYQSHPDEVVAWHDLRRFCLPLIAAATHDRHVLERLVNRDLGPHLEQLRHLEPHARFLYRLHHVLLAAPLRFVDLPTGRAFDLRIDAVASNFELHSLLLAALGDDLEQDVPSQAIVACLNGRGPRQLLEKSESAWALYTHEAVGDLLAGRKAPMKHWIWNEAIPAEIPAFDGARVVVAMPASFIREWETGRTFSALGGTVKRLAEVPRAEAGAYIRRIATASAS